jgi:hypothetical protein
MRQTADEILIRRYLLGDLPQEERTQLENRYLTDANLFEEVLASENDLIDSYARGELTEADRHKFDAEYLKSTQWRERVEFARALSHVSMSAKQAVATNEISSWKKVWAAFSVQQRMPQWALAAAAIVVVAGGSWLMVQNQRFRIDLKQALAGQAELRGGQETLRQHIKKIEGNLKDQTRQDQQGTEVTKLETPAEIMLSLTPGMARGIGESQNTLILPPTAARVRLQLMMDRDDYASYLAVLRTAEGREVNRQWLKSQRVGNQRAVVAVLSSDRLRPGDHVLTLLGSNGTPGAEEEAEAYSFRVVRK